MSLRRTGRTTRIVDAAVQSLFSTGSAVVEDHEGGSLTEVMFALRTRLMNEHNHMHWEFEGNRIWFVAKMNKAEFRDFQLKD